MIEYIIKNDTEINQFEIFGVISRKFELFTCENAMHSFYINNIQYLLLFERITKKGKFIFKFHIKKAEDKNEKN